MRKAVAVIAYTRFEYFEPVLSSILTQTVNGRPASETYDIYLFQDGLWERENESHRLGHGKIAELMTHQGPGIQAFHQPTNLSVARHFDFIEKKLFVEHDYDVVVFCEDDMILAPGYMAAMDMMAEKFHGDARVGMFSANPGNAMRPLEDQKANLHRYCSMQHNWGFGLSRTFWEKRQKFVDLYLRWGESFEYRQRPSRDIFLWLEAAGFLARSSSQDYVKSCATAALGAIKLATYVNYGLPIGEEGLHSTPTHFKKLGFDQTVVFDEMPVKSFDLDDAQFQELWKTHAAGHLKHAAGFDGHAWGNRLDNGEFEPGPFIASAVEKRDALLLATESDVASCYKMLLGRFPESEAVVKARAGLPVTDVLASFLDSTEFSTKAAMAPLFDKASRALAGHLRGASVTPANAGRPWAAADVPSRPNLSPDGVTLLQEHLRSVRCYREYGAGGSTVLAAESAVTAIHTVESDKSYLAAVVARIAQAGSSTRLRSHYVDIGPTGAWGAPTDQSHAYKWPRYCTAPWLDQSERGNEAELILIDGRFRVACFLVSLLNAHPGSIILFNDYTDRANYHAVERHLAPVSLAGHTASFVVPADIDNPSIIADVLAYCTDSA